MKDGLWKKGLVLGIILLFVTVSISPVVTAIYKDSYADYELMYKSKKDGKSDDYTVIITSIRGGGHNCEWIKQKGFFRGDIKVVTSTWGPPLSISGLAIKNGRLIRFSMNVEHVRAYNFIGILTEDFVWGRALGKYVYWS